MVWREGLRGGGVGMRVVGEICEEKLEMVGEWDGIVGEEIGKLGVEGEMWE